MIFSNSASSAASLVFYLPGECTHTDTKGKQIKASVRNILKSLEKAQYLMNTLYISIYLSILSFYLPENDDTVVVDGDEFRGVGEDVGDGGTKHDDICRRQAIPYCVRLSFWLCVCMYECRYVHLIYITPRSTCHFTFF